MSPQEIDRILAETWDDHRVSRGERKAIKALVADRTVGVRHQIRHQAFERAERLIADGAEAAVVLRWLEALVKTVWPDNEPSAPASAGAQAYFSPDGDIPSRLIRLLDAARRSIDICVFTITDDRVSAAIRSAHRRDVQVRILSDGDKAGDMGSDVVRLSSAGVPVRYDTSSHHMHHKFAIFDGQTLVAGSYNWTRSAARDNEENVIITREGGLIQQFSREFDRLWVEYAATQR